MQPAQRVLVADALNTTTDPSSTARQLLFNPPLQLLHMSFDVYCSRPVMFEDQGGHVHAVYLYVRDIPPEHRGWAKNQLENIKLFALQCMNDGRLAWENLWDRDCLGTFYFPGLGMRDVLYDVAEPVEEEFVAGIMAGMGMGLGARDVLYSA
jgi:hypothetical protein